MTPSLCVVVLAAGEGTRMRSARPKPLHKLCGKALVSHVIDAITELHPDRCVVVVGHASELVGAAVREQASPKLSIGFANQEIQRGTGDATLAGLNELPDELGSVYDEEERETDVIVLPGDTPLLRTSTLAALLAVHRSGDAAATVLSAKVLDPTGYGRIVRGRDGRVQRIVEEGDASEEDRAINEINTGVYVFRRGVLAPALRRLSPENAQGEYYLPDVIQVFSSAGYWVSSMQLTDPSEAMGVNDRIQLAAAEREMRERINARLLVQGVTLMDPAHTYVDATVEVESDVTIFPGSLLQGNTVVGARAQIGPNTRLVDAIIGEDVIVESSVVRNARIGDASVVGPFAAIEGPITIEAQTRTGAHFSYPEPTASKATRTTKTKPTAPLD